MEFSYHDFISTGSSSPQSSFTNRLSTKALFRQDHFTHSLSAVVQSSGFYHRSTAAVKHLPVALMAGAEKKCCEKRKLKHYAVMTIVDVLLFFAVMWKHKITVLHTKRQREERRFNLGDSGE